MFQVIEYRVHLVVVIDFGLCLRLCRQGLGFRVYCLVEFLIEKESDAVFYLFHFWFLLQKLCLGRCVVLLQLKMSIFSKWTHIHTLSGNLVYLMMEGNLETQKLLEGLLPKVCCCCWVVMILDGCLPSLFFYYITMFS